MIPNYLSIYRPDEHAPSTYLYLPIYLSTYQLPNYLSTCLSTFYLSIRLGPTVARTCGEHTVLPDGSGTASASNLGGGDDGKVAAPTLSSTQKTASHLIRLGRTACGVDHAVRGADPPPPRV